MFFLIGGIIVGAGSFAPFPLAIAPVVFGKQNADMLKGMASLAVSAIALLAFTLIVYAVFGEAFRMFLVGEAVGFVSFMLGFAVVVVRHLGNTR